MPEPRLAPLPFAPDQYGCRNPRSGADDTISGTHTVHTRRQGNGGRMLPCRPRRKAEYCRHGRDLRCRRTHNDREACLGKPLCPDCYDYRHAVVWNAHAPELWRRTTITLRRLLERATGSRVHLSYAKVAEFQARGVVHFHALIRLDGHDPHDPARLIPPPAGLTAGDLDHAIRQAVTATWFATRTHPAKPAGWDIAWGPQLDIRTIGTGVDGDITDSKVAGYLAKYATKSTEPAGITAIRVTPDNLHLLRQPPHPPGPSYPRLLAARRPRPGRRLHGIAPLGQHARLPGPLLHQIPPLLGHPRLAAQGARCLATSTAPRPGHRRHHPRPSSRASAS